MEENLHNLCSVLFGRAGLLKSLFPIDAGQSQVHECNGTLLGDIEGEHAAYVVEEGIVYGAQVQPGVQKNQKVTNTVGGAQEKIELARLIIKSKEEAREIDEVSNRGNEREARKAMNHVYFSYAPMRTIAP